MHNYENQLKLELSQLQTELATIAIFHEATDDWEVRNDDSEHNSADDNMVADNVESSSEREATLGLLEARYRNIRLALSKMTAGTFGTCEVCNEPIEANRLDANPAARTCITHRELEPSLPR